jgi:nicotinic acid phosphoribosyltransferase
MTNPTKPLFQTDAYKLGHKDQYPEGTQFVFSNYTNRGSRIKGIDKVVNFGLQAFLQEWAIEGWKEFFAAPENLVANDYEAKVNALLGPNTIGSDHIRALHRKGYLPLEFRQLPEGTLVPLRVPSFTIENTEPEFFWLVNYVETIVSNSIWQAQTSATLAHRFRGLLDSWAERTGGDLEFVNFQAHDFSARGMSSDQSARYSGAGHLLSSLGTDTLTAIDWVNEYYPSTSGTFIGGSVPATEHSVMCAGGNDEGDEQATFQRLLNIYPSGIVSVVSDTWDLWNVLTVILPNLKDQIMGRDGKLVIRPDSGDPVDILTGTARFLEDDWFEGWRTAVGAHPAEVGVIELLWDVFGGTVNEKGYKVLDPHIGAIYGDSITYERADEICARLEAKGFASTNVVFGVGSYTYQYNTRDTFGSAIKATYVVIDGEGKAIYKDPATDNGLKKSARGRLVVLLNDDGELVLSDGLTQSEQAQMADWDEMHTIWKDGEFVYSETFQAIRDRLAEQE